MSVQIFDLIAQSIDTHNLYSAKLYSLKRNLELNSGVNYEPSQIFRILATKIIMSGISSLVTLSWENHLQYNLIAIVEELWEKGLSNALNHVSINDSLFRSVEFLVPWEKFSEWLIDILDCVYFPNSRKTVSFAERRLMSKPDVAKLRIPLAKFSSKELYGEGGVFAHNMGPFRKFAIKMIQNPVEDKIKILMNKRQNKFGHRNDFILEKSPEHAGFIDEEFFPISARTEEDYDYSYIFGADGKRDGKIDKKRNIPEYAYCKINYANKFNINGVRGGAWNMFIGCNFFSNNINNIVGKIAIFKKKQSLINPYRYFDTCSVFIIYVGKRTMRDSIEGYDRIEWDKSTSIGSDSIYKSDEIVLEGKKYSKRDAISNSEISGKLMDLDSYFGTIKNIDILKQEINAKGKTLKIISENLPVNEKYWELHTEFESIVNKLYQHLETVEKTRPLTSNEQKNKKMFRKMKKRAQLKRKKRKSKLDPYEESKIDDPEETKENIGSMEQTLADMSSILKKIEQGGLDEIINWGESKGAKIQLEQEVSYYKFAEPLDLVNDPEFLSQFDTLFPNYWSSLVRNEIGITKQIKKMRLRFAETQIRCMPQQMRNKYNKLYLIVKSIICSLPTVNTMSNISMEFALDIDNLFDIDNEIMEEFEISGLDLAADPRDNIGKIDWDVFKD